MKDAQEEAVRGVRGEESRDESRDDSRDMAKMVEVQARLHHAETEVLLARHLQLLNPYIDIDIDIDI